MMKKNMRSFSYLQSNKVRLSLSLIVLLALGGCQTTGGLYSTHSDKTIDYPTDSSRSSQGVILQTEDNSQLSEIINQTDTSQPSDSNQSSSDTQNQYYHDSSKPNSPKKERYTQLNNNQDTSDSNTPIYTPEPSTSIDSRDQSNPELPDTIYVIKPPKVDAKTARQELLERARQNSRQKTQSARTIQDGSNIPAFRKLMNTGVKQLREGQLSVAQSTFTRAQRLAPQSSAVYFYLGQVALKQNQALKAEAMARRGLVVAQSSSRKMALWQLILQSAQMQGNQKVINEAKVALSR